MLRVGDRNAGHLEYYEFQKRGTINEWESRKELILFARTERGIDFDKSATLAGSVGAKALILEGGTLAISAIGAGGDPGPNVDAQRAGGDLRNSFDEEAPQMAVYRGGSGARSHREARRRTYSTRCEGKSVREANTILKAHPAAELEVEEVARHATSGLRASLGVRGRSETQTHAGNLSVLAESCRCVERHSELPSDQRNAHEQMMCDIVRWMPVTADMWTTRSVVGGQVCHRTGGESGGRLRRGLVGKGSPRGIAISRALRTRSNVIGKSPGGRCSACDRHGQVEHLIPWSSARQSAGRLGRQVDGRRHRRRCEGWPTLAKGHRARSRGKERSA